ADESSVRPVDDQLVQAAVYDVDISRRVHVEAGDLGVFFRPLPGTVDGQQAVSLLVEDQQAAGVDPGAGEYVDALAVQFDAVHGGEQEIGVGVVEQDERP